MSTAQGPISNPVVSAYVRVHNVNRHGGMKNNAKAVHLFDPNSISAGWWKLNSRIDHHLEKVCTRTTTFIYPSTHGYVSLSLFARYLPCCFPNVIFSS